MSRIRFLCPSCSARLSVESDSVHQFTECPKCRRSIRAWGAQLLDIKFACSECGKKMVIDAEAAGCTIRCPGCQSSNRVPGEQTATQKTEPVQSTAPKKNAATAPGERAAPLLTSEEVTFLVGDSK